MNSSSLWGVGRVDRGVILGMPPANAMVLPFVALVPERPARSGSEPELAATRLAALVQRAQAGDRGAMSQVIAEQQSYVYSIALGLMRRPEDAADLTQEAFLRLCQVIGSYRGETKFTTWLYRLVTNLGLDLLRRRGRSKEATFADGEIDLPDSDPLIDPAQLADRHEATALIRAALDALPTSYRMALTLYYFRELKYEEIAAVLDLPLNTVKAHLRRGKLALARQLGVAEAQEER
ncbi:MAG TPA: sigma-70 family RNA polymerase sigma factor [Chloroflexota bacterium]